MESNLDSQFRQDVIDELEFDPRFNGERRCGRRERRDTRRARQQLDRKTCQDCCGSSRQGRACNRRGAPLVETAAWSAPGGYIRRGTA